MGGWGGVVVVIVAQGDHGVEVVTVNVVVIEVVVSRTVTV